MSVSAPRTSANGPATAATCSACRRVDRSTTTLAFRMDDRKQRIIVDADGGEGIGFFGWEVADAAALDALGGAARAARHQGRARLARAGRRAARQGPDRARTIRSATGWRFSTAPRARPIRSSPAARSRASAPGRSASAMWCCRSRTDRAVLRVLSRGLLGFRLSDYYFHPFPALLHARQSAPPQPRDHPDRQERRASHHDGAVQLRRRRAGLRHRARRGGSRRGDARAAHQRLPHVVLFVDAVGLHGRVRLGRAADRACDLAGRRAQGRPELLGPRARLARAGEARRGARRCGSISPRAASGGRCR